MAWAKARPSQAEAEALGLGLGFARPQADQSRGFQAKPGRHITITLSKPADLIDSCWPIFPVLFFVRIYIYFSSTTVVHVVRSTMSITVIIRIV